MKIIELSFAQLQELKPFVDTLILPVCSVGNESQGPMFAHDLQLVRDCAERIENQISGRVFLLPEAVHTSATGDASPDQKQVLRSYLYQLVLPYKMFGFDKVALLYGAGTPQEALEQAVNDLAEEGFRALALSCSDSTSTDWLVQQVVEMWQR